MLKTARIHGKSLALAEGLAAILCLGAPAAVAQSKYIPPAQLPGQNGSSPPGQVPGQTNPVQLDPTPARCSTCDDSPGVNSNAQQMADKIFVRKESASALAEAQMGKLASARAVSPAVKELGSVMAAEQSALAASLRQIAESLLVMLPTQLDKKGQAELSRLNGLVGSAFDAEYLRFLSKDLRVAQRDCGAEINLTANPGLRNVAANADTLLRQHLATAQMLAKSQSATASK